RVAADIAANQPLFRDAMEHALEGISQAQLVSETNLETMRGRISTISSAIGTTFGERLSVEFGEQDITKITTPQLVAFVETYGDGGNAAARELVNNYNREIVARKLAGLDTT